MDTTSKANTIQSLSTGTKDSLDASHKSILCRRWVKVAGVALIAILAVNFLSQSFPRLPLSILPSSYRSGPVSPPRDSQDVLQDEGMAHEYYIPASISNWAEAPPPIWPMRPIMRSEVPYGGASCWPSTGGIWMKELDAVEMAYLGIDRFNNVPRAADPVEEDTFCAKLRRMGASWWRSPELWPRPTRCDFLEECARPDIHMNMELCFPATGGAWVIDFTKTNTPHRGHLGLSLTMDERCKVIQTLGGKFCSTMEACAETHQLIGEMPSWDSNADPWWTWKDPYVPPRTP